MKRPLRIAIAQMNPTVGDYAGNAKKILSWITKAERKNADIIVFPELALSGYPVWDLANKTRFVEEGLKHLKQIERSTKNKKIAVVLGFIDQYKGLRDRHDATRNSYNALAFIEKGKVKFVQHKRLLPTYDVFLEDIFFKAGEESTPVKWKNMKLGFTICEDIWDEKYRRKPIEDLKKQGADFIINISASPYFKGIAEARDSLLKKHSKKHGVPILYVNKAGAQDDLIFDGRSLFVGANGKVLFRAPAFTEGLFFYDWHHFTPRRCEIGTRSAPLPDWTSEPKEMYDALVLGIKDYFRKNGFKKAVIGLSGGIDSALVAALAVDALGADAVKGVTMPGPFSSEGSWRDSEKLAKNLGMEFSFRSIKEKYETWIKDSGIPKNKLSLATENLQARLRGLELMFISNDEGRLLLSTGNKSELAMGYCTLYGDMAGGLSVLGDVYKTDVYKLSWYRNLENEVIPKAILTKAPSAELRPNQKDEDFLPPYEVLDEILKQYIEKNLSSKEIVNYFLCHREESSSKATGRGDLTTMRLRRGARNDMQKEFFKLVKDIISKVDHNEYKRRQTAPAFRVTEKAWFGRRMPITNQFKN